MAISSKLAIQAIISRLAELGVFEAVRVGEPVAPPQDWTVAVFNSRKEPHPEHPTTLVGAIDLRTFIVRIYVSAFAEPMDEKEYRLDELEAAVEAALAGDFQLDAASGVRNVEAGGFSADYGYVQIGEGPQSMFRYVDISVPITFDGNSTFAP